VRVISTSIGMLGWCFFILIDPTEMTLVTKLVGVDMYHELYFVICILLYIFEYICWLIY